jgi:2-keto-4-pentenoate hydratase
MTGDARRIDALAERQWRDYRACTPGTCFAEPGFALTLDDAYRLQHAVAALRVAADDRVIGYKVGCTGAGVVAQFGMAGPISGRLYHSEVCRSGARLDAAGFANPAIEGEMAVRIGEDGEAEAAFPVIELHNYVFRAPRPALAELVANNGLNAGIVLPEAAWMASRDCLARQDGLSVRINGTVLAAGELWPLPGGAAASVAWLRRHLAGFGLELAPGQIVLAGTPLGLYPVGVGDEVAVCVDGRAWVGCFVQ